MSANVQPSQATPGGMQRGAPWASPNYVASTFFTYESDVSVVTGLAAGAAAQLTFNVAGDSDFFWTKFCAFALVGGVGTVRNADQLPAVTILITNTTTGRQYMNNPVPLASISGTGNFPFILPMVVLWQAFATIQIALSNEGNQTYSNLQLSFIGIKAYTSNTPNPNQVGQV